MGGASGAQHAGSGVMMSAAVVIAPSYLHHVGACSRRAAKAGYGIAGILLNVATIRAPNRRQVAPGATNVSALGGTQTDAPNSGPYRSRGRPADIDPTLVYLTGSMRCSYGVPAHMTYGFAVSGFASRG